MKLRARVARRYAQALHDEAAALSVLPHVTDDLAGLRRSLATCPELAGFLPDYLVPARTRAATLAALWAETLHPLTWRFIRLLESKRRLGVLDDICAEFMDREEARRGMVRGRLTAAYAMAPDELRDAAGRLGRHLGREVVLATDEDPRLLGGFRLQMGDRVHDFSLAARLRLFRETMMAGCGQGN